MKENLEATEPTVLRLFVDTEGTYRLWLDTNAPKKIENPDFYVQKLNDVHENPERKGYVARTEHWLWSSANPDSPLAVTIFLDLGGGGASCLKKKGDLFEAEAWAGRHPVATAGRAEVGGWARCALPVLQSTLPPTHIGFDRTRPARPLRLSR